MLVPLVNGEYTPLARMSSLAPGSSVVPRGRLSPVTGRRGGSVDTSGRHLLSSSAFTSRSLLCLQFTKGSLLQISVWSIVLGSPKIHLAALFGIVKLYRKQIAS